MSNRCSWLVAIIGLMLMSSVMAQGDKDSDDVVIRKCRQVVAPHASSQPAYGKGSIARCDAGEVVIGGSCASTTSPRNTDSRFLVSENNTPVAIECIPTQGGASGEVTARISCCK